MNRTQPTADFAFAILAGGKSSRMGVSKAGVTLADGKSFFDHVFKHARELGMDCIAVGHVEGIDAEAYPDLHVQPDQVTDRGPVGALLGLFSSGRALHYLVVACDQPLLTTNLLRRLLDVADNRPSVFCDPQQERVFPLPGLYPAGGISIVQNLLLKPSASLRELLEVSNARKIPLNEYDRELLRGANTPQDVADLNAKLRALR